MIRRRMYDEKAHGEYRTKRVILDIYDAMAEASRTGRPYQTRLDPPPPTPASRWNVRELARQIEASAVERSVLGPEAPHVRTAPMRGPSNLPLEDTIASNCAYRLGYLP